MIPFGRHTVTLYHKGERGWTKHTLHGCSWRMTYARQLYDNVQRMGSEVCICRWTDGIKAAPGDVLVLGEAADVIRSGVDVAGVLERNKGAAFVCESFHDNTHDGMLRHYCARGAAYGL